MLNPQQAPSLLLLLAVALQQVAPTAFAACQGRKSGQVGHLLQPGEQIADISRWGWRGKRWGRSQAAQLHRRRLPRLRSARLS
jgi:hypothetical protein